MVKRKDIEDDLRGPLVLAVFLGLAAALAVCAAVYGLCTWLLG
jgi:hypothetical protein